jgi:hypothetical protein
MAAGHFSVYIQFKAGRNALKRYEYPFSPDVAKLKVFHICREHAGHILVETVIGNFLYCVRNIYRLETFLPRQGTILGVKSLFKFPVKIQ